MDHESWDNLAADYDVSVEDNPSPLIVDYIDQEIQILNVLCEKHAQSTLNADIDEHPFE